MMLFFIPIKKRGLNVTCEVLVWCIENHSEALLIIRYFMCNNIAYYIHYYTEFPCPELP